jgi:DNA-binding transcriptional LysR family regulator
MVTLVQLRVIDAVRRHGSVTAAAKDSRYTQPSISHHLSRLEAQLGARLLQRAGRPPAGRPGSRDHRPGRLGDRGAVRAGWAERGPGTRLPVPPRQIYAATYGEPPDPPATAALVAALTQAAGTR